MNALLFIGIYLLIGLLFSRFIKWGNKIVIAKVDKSQKLLGNKEHNALIILWPMFLIVFVFQFIRSIILQIKSKL
jgi:hypothetical protein